MIYLTGDTHGDFQRIAHFCARMHTKPSDIMIILGDAGINFYGGWRDQHKKKFISALPITLFCIHGNHEQRPATIPSYTEQEWHGGAVYVEEQFPSILFAKDGEVYELNGMRAIVIGGAYSIDWMLRIPGRSWWPDEQPSTEIRTCVESRLDQLRWKVDVVLSHTVPLKYEPVEVFLPGIDQRKVDKSTEQWLDSVEDRLRYVIPTLVDVLDMNEEDARAWFSDKSPIEFSIAQLVSDIREYVDKQPKNFRLLFMIDEVGQYVGTDTDMLLNLQSLTEKLGSECQGKVWVICTGQEAIDEIIKVRADEFSRIQARFKTRLSLTSSSGIVLIVTS